MIVLYDIIFEAQDAFACSYLAGFGFHDKEISFFGELMKITDIVGVKILDDGGTKVAAQDLFEAWRIL